MWIYALLLLLPLLCAAAERAQPKLRAAGYAFVWLALVLFLGLRHQVGCDWNSYLLFFHRAQTHDLLNALALSEPGFMLLGWIVARLGLGFGMFNAVLAAIFATGVVAFARRQPSPALALFVATPVLIAIMGLGSPRQGAAVGLFMLAMSLYLSGRRRVPAALILASLLFHWTALALLPLAALMLLRLRVPPRVLAGLAVAASLAVIAITLFVPVLLPVAQGGVYRAIPGVAALAASVVFLRGRGLREEERTLYGYLLALTLFSSAMIVVSPTITDRLGLYGIAFQMMVFSRLPFVLRPAWQRALAILAVAGLYLGLFGGWLLLTTQKPCFVPYSSYLTQPHLLVTSEPEPEWLPCGLNENGDIC